MYEYVKQHFLVILYFSTVNKKDDFHQKTMLHKCFLFVYMAFYIPTYHAKLQNYQRIFQVIVTTGASGLVLQTEIAYGDFLMRPEKMGSF